MTESALTALQLLEEAARYADSIGNMGWAKSARAAIRAAPPATALPGQEVEQHCIALMILKTTGCADDKAIAAASMIDRYYALISARAASVEAKPVAWNAAKHDEIIKRLMNDIGMPDSVSVYGAFKQFANELHALAHRTTPSPAPDAGAEEERK